MEYDEFNYHRLVTSEKKVAQLALQDLFETLWNQDYPNTPWTKNAASVELFEEKEEEYFKNSLQKLTNKEKGRIISKRSQLAQTFRDDNWKKYKWDTSKYVYALVDCKLFTLNQTDKNGMPISDHIVKIKDIRNEIAHFTTSTCDTGDFAKILTSRTEHINAFQLAGIDVSPYFTQIDTITLQEKPVSSQEWFDLRLKSEKQRFSIKIYEMKEKHVELTQRLIESHRKDTKRLIEKHGEDTQRLKEKHDEDTRLIEKHDEDTKRFKEKHDKDTKRLKEKQDEDTQRLIEKHDEDTQRLIEKHDEDTQRLNEKHDEDSRLIEKHDEDTKKLIEKHDQDTQRLIEKQDEDTQRLIVKHHNDTQRLKEKHDEDTRLIEKHDKDTKRFKEKHDEDTRLIEKHDEDTKRLIEKHDEYTMRLKAECEAKEKADNEKIKKLEEEIRKLQSENSKTIRFKKYAIVTCTGIILLPICLLAGVLICKVYLHERNAYIHDC